MNDFKTISLEISEAVATINLIRTEKRNALNTKMLSELTESVRLLESREDVQIFILTGGNKVFSAGYDLQEDYELLASNPHGYEHIILENAFTVIRNCSKPSIAMVNGFAIGAGCDLMLNCDLRIASEGARFGMTPAKIGVTYSDQGLRRFIDNIGIANTKYLFMSGRIIDAVKAKEIGLINDVVPLQEIEDFTYSLAGEIANNAPLSVKAIKRVANIICSNLSLPRETWGEINSIKDQVFLSTDYREGRTAFMEKRKPIFKGI